MVGRFTFARSVSIIIKDRVLWICLRYYYTMEAGGMDSIYSTVKISPGSHGRCW